MRRQVATSRQEDGQIGSLDKEAGDKPKVLPLTVCTMLSVGSFACELIESDRSCKCRYMAPQTCDYWFSRVGVKEMTVETGRGALVLPENGCKCYAGEKKREHYCHFGFGKKEQPKPEKRTADNADEEAEEVVEAKALITEAKAKALIAELADDAGKLVKPEDVTGISCNSIEVGSFVCNFIEADHSCQCRYMAPQVCDYWFAERKVNLMMARSKGPDGILLMPEDKCMCYDGEKSREHYCSFGFLDSVPKIAIGGEEEALDCPPDLERVKGGRCMHSKTRAEIDPRCCNR